MQVGFAMIRAIGVGFAYWNSVSTNTGGDGQTESEKAGNVKPHEVCRVLEGEWDPEHQTLNDGERFKPRKCEMD